MEISLNGRSAIVTGASKGIGFAIAKRFAESGADVAIVARGREPLDAAVTEIKTVTNAHVIGVQGDVAKAKDVQRAYDEAMAAFGKLDIAVNNAGTSRAGPFEAMSDEVLQSDLELKLFAAVRVSPACAQVHQVRWLAHAAGDAHRQILQYRRRRGHLLLP